MKRLVKNRNKLRKCRNGIYDNYDQVDVLRDYVWYCAGYTHFNPLAVSEIKEGQKTVSFLRKNLNKTERNFLKI